MSEGQIKGYTWPGYKKTLDGPAADHPNSQRPQGAYVPLYEKLRREALEKASLREMPTDFP